jgi:type I restriction enzyme S subunit
MMKQYDSYKDSGIEWIGKIPSHWGSAPIKYTVKSPYNSFIDGDWIESKVIVSDGIRYLTTGNVGALKYKEQGSGFISESTFKELNCSEVFPGDILISRLNEPIGRACIVPDLGYRIVVAVDNVIYRPDTDLYDKQFLIYQMNCKPYADMANFIARGSTMSRVSRTTLGHFQLIIPPLIEQKVIASYLDKKCGEIDKAIATQEKRVELLKELRQNIITQAVTRGINPDVPFKDSGVEWIGEVPGHWEVRKLKNICKSEKYAIKTGPFGSQLKGEDLQPEGDVRVYSQRNVIDNNFEDINFYVSNAKAKDLESFYTQPSDLLITSRGTIGKCAILPDDAPMGILHPCLIAMRVEPSICDIKWVQIYMNESTCF